MGSTFIISCPAYIFIFLLALKLGMVIQEIKITAKINAKTYSQQEDFIAKKEELLRRSEHIDSNEEHPEIITESQIYDIIPSRKPEPAVRYPSTQSDNLSKVSKNEPDKLDLASIYLQKQQAALQEAEAQRLKKVQKISTRPFTKPVHLPDVFETKTAENPTCRSMLEGGHWKNWVWKRNHVDNWAFSGEFVPDNCDLYAYKAPEMHRCLDNYRQTVQIIGDSRARLLYRVLIAMYRGENSIEDVKVHTDMDNFPFAFYWSQTFNGMPVRPDKHEMTSFKRLLLEAHRAQCKFYFPAQRPFFLKTLNFSDHRWRARFTSSYGHASHPRKPYFSSPKVVFQDKFRTSRAYNHAKTQQTRRARENSSDLVL